jgi:hypothetical protein
LNFDFIGFNLQAHETIPHSMHHLYISMLISILNPFGAKGIVHNVLKCMHFVAMEGKEGVL